MSNPFKPLFEFMGTEEFKTAFEQFKASKEPKKEWEIVAYSGNIGFGNRVYQLCNDGEYRWKGIIDKMPRSAENLLDKGCTIHSVRRLSDGEVFSVGDRIETPLHPEGILITGFEIQKDMLFVKQSVGYFSVGVDHSGDYFKRVKKLPAPLFTTVDGKEIHEGNEFWAVYKEDYAISEVQIAHVNSMMLWKGTFLFSTREAALEYIIQHKPCLSVEDVKGLLTKCLCDETVEQVADFLTTLVKSKL